MASSMRPPEGAQGSILVETSTNGVAPTRRLPRTAQSVAATVSRRRRHAPRGAGQRRLTH
eukprot:scaffold947_cov375-Prasinococcus_capsulatus_cf.AAC.14